MLEESTKEDIFWKMTTIDLRFPLKEKNRKLIQIYLPFLRHICHAKMLNDSKIF